MRTVLCVCPPRVESLFPPVLSKSCNQIPLAFKVWFSRNSCSFCRTRRLGSLTCGSQPSLQWVDFCGISVLQFVSHPPSSYGILFYCDCAPPTISLWLLLCLWMLGIFLVSSSVLLSMIVRQLVVIPVLSQEGVRARPSTLPSWTNFSTITFKKWMLLFPLYWWRKWGPHVKRYMASHKVTKWQKEALHSDHPSLPFVRCCSITSSLSQKGREFRLQGPHWAERVFLP